MPKLHILHRRNGRCRSQARVHVWILPTLGDIRIKFEHFDDCLRILLVVILGDRRGLQKSLPFRRETNELPIHGIKANMNAMGEIGRVTDATHSRTAVVDGINPFIDLIVGL